MIPHELCEAVKLLSEKKIALPTHGTDSRQDSATAESHIVHILQNETLMIKDQQLNIYSPNVGKRTNRQWYDVKIGDYFCDIKVSALSTNDNTNAKNAMYYFLTGKEPENVSQQEGAFFKKMRENECPCDERDYYYIVVNKNHTDDVFAVSLRGITKVSPAPNNLPFQCRWDLCRESKPRTWEQAKEYLLGQWAVSIQRKIDNAKKGMPEYYPEFFSE